MAILLPNKFKEDLGAKKVIGFGFPLNGNAVFNPTYQTKDQIKANLINYLLTNKNERVFRPNWGSNLRGFLFENITDKSLEDLEIQIQDHISKHFPMVRIIRLAFNTIYDDNSIEFSLKYKIEAFGVEDELNILLN